MGRMPMLDELMPWGVRPLRLGRSWVLAPDPGTLTARWDALVRAEGAERTALFHPTRVRTPEAAVSQLPGQRGATTRFAAERGRCPAPVPVAHGPFDRQWLLPDHRLIDVARPELWRVADDHQVFVVEQGTPAVGSGSDGDLAGPAVVVSPYLPDGHAPAGRPGRIRPLFRRPGGVEPNLAPGLLPALGERYGREVDAFAVLAWILAAARHSPAGCAVPLPTDPEVFFDGVDLGRQLLDVQLRGARGGDRPRLPGGRRPYVRAAVPPRPTVLDYDRTELSLHLDDGRISPVPAEAWDLHVGGVRMLEHWFALRTAGAEPGTLAALRPASWPQEWTSDLLELITVLALLGELAPRRAALSSPAAFEEIAELPGVLPPPAASRRPASVLDHREEGPDGQFALL
ncbi:type ISP restriction/modification enzyme [Streptomyces sp. NPDC048057]|uniref:type ISP restriction/modification enzyme n=1 Tax=Streptomyces sp. NPDC048057 TaxID=3155628 RepID=UPI0033E070C0